MKNVVLLVVSALSLFAISAGISMYLNTPAAGKTSRVPDPEPVKPVSAPAAKADTDAVNMAAELKERLDAVKDREAKLAARQKQMDIVLEDIRAERTALDMLRQQVAAELKRATDRVGNRDQKTVEVSPESKAPVAAPDQSESPNVLRMAALYDAMAPEVAAKVLQQLIGSGRADTAAKVLAQMPPAKANRVLVELKDPALAADLLEKMKGATPAPVPTPGG